MNTSSESHNVDKIGLTAISTATRNHEPESALHVMDTRHKSTQEDQANMRRMGREQELVRNFRFISMVSFAALATAAWELAMFAISPALANGGRPNLIYSSIWWFVGFGPIYLSMAEMASMAPIAGAQYHWVSEFAPENCQRCFSYFTGWFSTLAWQSGNAWGLILIGTLLQSIISLNIPDYEGSNWHGTLFVIAFTVLALCANIFGAKALPRWQNPVFALHILVYFAVVLPVWINGPKVESAAVWGQFEFTGGWSTDGLAVLVGQLPAIACQVGIDSAVHMSEEVTNASKAVPRVMMVTYVVNYIFIFFMLVTICYHMPNVEHALNDPTEYPVIYVLKQSMGPPWVTVLLVLILLLLFLGNLSYLAAVTRDLFAFARDNGLPFSKWISKVDRRRDIPTNACILSGTICALLSLIYIGSPVAFYAVTSLCTVALLQCYCISIGCILWRRISRPETLPPSRFSLGRYGVAVNAAAVLFSFWGFFWCFWPTENSSAASVFNWSSPIFAAVALGALIYFVFVGRKHYLGPVILVEGRKKSGA